LPADYDTLTADGQRLARVAAASLSGAPELEMAGWSFFREEYLLPDPDDLFDPAFYKPPILPSAPIHFEIGRCRYSYPCSVLALPRGGAKSTTIRSLALRDLVTKRQYAVALFKAKDDFVIDDFDQIKQQIEMNRRINDDFGSLKPVRGRGLWSSHHLRLASPCLSSLTGLSIDGKKRGVRPAVVYLDDVEDDKSERSRSDIRLAELKEILLKVVEPMLDAGCNLVLVGTLLSKRSFLYHVLESPDDPRFRGIEEGGDWYKLNVPAVTSTGRNAWSAKFTEDFLAAKRRRMGDSFFETEYMGNPTSEQAVLFNILPDDHEYKIDEPDGTELLNPFSCEKLTSWYEIAKDTRAERSKPFKDFVGELYRGITIDYAPGQSAEADYSAVLVWGINHRAELFILDGWFGKEPSPHLASRAWRMALHWRVAIIAGEAVAIQMELMNRIREHGEIVRKQHGWAPGVLSVKYPANLSKADRIAGLEPRFNQGRVKLPAHRRLSGNQQDAVAELYRQIRAFTLDMRNLRWDDVIDSLAQVQFVVRGNSPNQPVSNAVETDLERLKAGEFYIEGTKIPLAGALEVSKLAPADLEVVLQQARANQAYQEEEAPDGDPVVTVNFDPSQPFSGILACPLSRPS
jgi:hypothetical protein